jgi:D-arabinose 1-dehydrogenase-like Zn-dependent alcohol dehydrogenase
MDWRRYCVNCVTQGDKVKAIVYTRYGPPDVLHLEEVKKPALNEEKVLVKVYAASINAGTGIC